MKIIKNKTIVFIIIFTMFFICNNEKFYALNDLNIKTLTNFEIKDEYNLTNNEINLKINENIKKVFTENIDYSIDSEKNKIILKLQLDESNGNIETLINTNIYNFLKNNDFKLYDITFDFDVKYKDNNGRFIKKYMYSYTFYKNTLLNTDFSKLDYKNVIQLADECWDINNGLKSRNIENDEKNIQELKILNILKDYFKYKFKNNTKK